MVVAEEPFVSIQEILGCERLIGGRRARFESLRKASCAPDLGPLRENAHANLLADRSLVGIVRRYRPRANQVPNGALMLLAQGVDAADQITERPRVVLLPREAHLNRGAHERGDLPSVRQRFAMALT